MLALIAGTGALPAELVAQLDAPPLVCALQGFEPAGVAVDISFRIETLGTLVAELTARGVTELCMAGGVRRPPIDPAAIKMIYWYAQFPNEPEQFDYSLQLFQRDEQFLSRLVEQIKNSDFPLVESHQPCHHCVYRSYCNRGDSAGPLTELPPEAEPDATLDVLALDWEQIAEIQF